MQKRFIFLGLRISCTRSPAFVNIYINVRLHIFRLCVLRSVRITELQENMSMIMADDCSASLGMQTGQIPDSAITASSSSGPSFRPANARYTIICSSAD